MSKPRITYTPRPDTTREAEVTALCNAYSFVIKSNEAKRKAGGTNASDNDEKQERR